MGGVAKCNWASRAMRNFWQGVHSVAGRKLELGRISEYGVWAETINPLRGLTEQRARDIFDDARRGIYADIAYLYQEIEAADPTLLTCTERRESVVGASKWRISPVNPDRARGYDEALANEQQAFLYEAYGQADDGLGELAEHLERGFFRGFAHARPIYGRDCVEGFEVFNQWNFAYDKLHGEWWWNPDATTVFGDGFTPIPAGELVSVVRQRHIDYPALLVFIRAALGEKKYGVWLERYGIPPVTVIMPQEAVKDEEEAYFRAAERLAEAGRGALPYGTQVSYATEARGTNPFLEFLRHQQELIVLMATGGTLTSLSSPTGIGSGASDAHERSWLQIVARDIRASSRALNRTVTPRLLEMRFPGRPMLAMFEFDVEPSPTAAQVFDDAAKARSGGYLIDRGELEDASGYKLVPDHAGQAPAGGPWPVPPAPPAPALNKDAPDDPETPSRIVATPLQNAPGGKDGSSVGLASETPQNANAGPLSDLAKSLAADLRPAAERVAALLALPEGQQADAAKALMEDMPGLLPEDPQMAAVLEMEVAEAFAEEVQGPGPAAGGWRLAASGGAAVENANDNREADGKFAQEGTGDQAGGAKAEEAKPDKSKFPTNYESDEGKWPKYDAASPEARKLNQQRGRHAILKSLHEEKDVANAMHRDSLGPIDFPYGKVGTKAKNHEDGYGVSKIAVKHPEALEKIPGVIAHGRIHKHDTEAGRFYVVSGRNVVILSKKEDANAFLVTGFDYSANRIAEITKNPLVENKGAEGGSDARLF